MQIEKLIALADSVGIICEELRGGTQDGEILLEAKPGFLLAAIETHSLAIPYGPKQYVETRLKALTEAELDIRNGVVECQDPECEWCADSKAGVGG